MPYPKWMSAGANLVSSLDGQYVLDDDGDLLVRYETDENGRYVRDADGNRKVVETPLYDAIPEIVED